MTITIPRRFFKLSLRSVLLLIAVVAVALWWHREYRGQDYAWTYPVADLASGPLNPGLIALQGEVQAAVRPGYWGARGGGSITPMSLSLSFIVRANPGTHRRVAEFLERKRRAAGLAPGNLTPRLGTNTSVP